MLIDTSSGKSGHVSLAERETLRGTCRLDESRRHARDLAPSVQRLLEQARWSPRDIDAVIVSLGPGSYTGLRVGIMSAKVFAYATGCAVLGVSTFAAIAERAPMECLKLDILADAQQDKVYVETFARTGNGWRAVVPLAVRRFADWLSDRDPSAWVSGPGLTKWETQLSPDVRLVDSELRDADAAGLLRLGLARFGAGERDCLWALEPLYLRPSSAEEQWAARHANR
jgi:tRNA threonylcarbamoyladenosine biosynthesis protein TsaB